MPYVGEIRLFAGNFAPAGWMFCNGQVLPITENETLFNLIGTTYGGDGQQTFALPNLQSRVPIHAGTGPDGTTYTLGEAAGTETVTLTVQQIPTHSHPLVASTDLAQLGNPINAVYARSAAIDYLGADEPFGNMAASAIAPVGGSQPHDNMQPFLCINYIISLFGVFPQQN
ncbi:phage tail protein [Verrucomicrobiota bacterium sgz303538]